MTAQDTLQILQEYSLATTTLVDVFRAQDNNYYQYYLREATPAGIIYATQRLLNFGNGHWDFVPAGEFLIANDGTICGWTSPSAFPWENPLERFIELKEVLFGDDSFVITDDDTAAADLWREYGLLFRYVIKDYLAKAK